MNQQRAFLLSLVKSIHLARSGSGLLWSRLGSVSAALLVAIALFTVILFALPITPVFARMAKPVAAAGGDILHPTANRAQAPPNCIELVVNGGFEQTAAGWNPVPGASLFAYATDQRASGRQSLLLGFSAPLNITAAFGVEQFLALPADSTSIEFSFAYAVQEQGGVDAGDQAYLTIHDAATDQLLAMLVLSPTGDTWNMGRYDLTPLAGQEIRLVFEVQNDGEPGMIAMRVDDVSIRACLPPEAFALTALPTPQPTPPSPTPELLLLTPAPPAATPPLMSPITPSVPAAGDGLVTPGMPQAQQVFPQAEIIDSLEECSCASSLYSCSSFSSWAVAQACYTRCQVAAGYDIHNLDPDRNGIACELELQDVAPLDATPSPQSTPSQSDDAVTNPVSDTTATGNMPSNVTGDLTGDVTGSTTTTMDSAAITLSVAPAASPSSVTVAAEISSAAAVSMPATTLPANSVVTTSEGQTGAVAVAIAPAAPSAAPVTNAAPPASSASSALTPLEMLSLLLFSPLGYLAVGALVTVGALSLWIAYLLGQRGQMANRPPALPPTVGSTVSDEYTLTPQNPLSAQNTLPTKSEISAPKS